LSKVADHAVRGWPGSGTWLQVGGFAFRHDTEARTASQLTWLGSGPRRPIASTDSILAVTGDYLVNPNADQDGYLMLNQGQIIDCPSNGIDLKDVVIAELKAAGARGIAPLVEGRICQSGSKGPCLAVAKTPVAVR
jgi:hypothetical protein